MKKSLPYQKTALHFFSILCVMLLFSNFTWGQATIFDETFGTTASATYTGGTSTTPSNVAYTVISNNGVVSTGVASGNGFLNLASAGTTATAVRPNLTYPFSSLSLGSFSTTLANNTLPVEWTVNMKANRGMSSSSSNDYGEGKYYLVVVLCSNSANLITAPTGTNGYALILQRRSGTNTLNYSGLRLVRFTNGLISGTGGVPVGTSATTLLAETPILTGPATTTAPNNLSVKVVYTPAGDNSTGTWELFYREDSGTTFVNPTTGTLTSAGTSADNTYTTTAMTHFGFLGSVSTSTATGNHFQIDNFKIKGGAATVPTITSTKSTLTGFAYNQGNGPSTGQSFTVAGINLTNNLVVTPSTNYEISDDSGVTYNSLARTYIPSSGTVSDKVILTRLKAGLTANAYNETVTVVSTGANVLSGVACSGGVTGFFYYNGTGPLASVSSWGSNSDGTGTQPVFTGNYQVFIIRNTTAVTTDAPWTVSGSNSKIILGDSTQPAITLTVASTFPITGTIDIPAAASSGSNSIVVIDAVLPTFGTLDNTSEVHLQGAFTYITSTTFGKLFVDGVDTTTINGNPVIKTSLTVPLGSRLTLSGSNSLYTLINPGASVAINGNLRISKQAGAFSYNVTTPASTLGSIQFKDAVPNFTLGAASTVEYSRNTLSSSQSISTLPDGVNYAKLSISDGNPFVNCPKSFAGAITVNDTFTLNQGASTLTGGGSLTLGDNATFVRTAGTLDAAPNFGTSVNVTYDGALNIDSGFEIPSATNVLKNLKIITTASAVVKLISSTNLTNKLTVTSGSLNSNGFLILKSSECCTAFVGELAAGAVTGDVTVERYIPMRRAWRALTAPVVRGTNNSVFFNWQNGGNPIANTGVEIWSNNPQHSSVTNGGSGSSMLSYSSSGNSWSGVTDTSTTNLFSSTINNPFMVFVTGPYAIASTRIASGAAATTLKATGSLLIGNQNYASLAGKYTFIGNPYASPLSLSTMLTDNPEFEQNIWVWDANATVTNSVGTYNLFNQGTYTNTTTNPAVVTGTLIQSGQAFFVKSAAVGSFVIKETQKGTTNSNAVFRDAAPAQLLRVGLYKQINNEWSGRDGAMTVILPNADANQTPNKMANGTENIAFTKNGLLFASEHHLPFVASDVLNVRVWNTTAGANYKLKLNTERFASTSLNATLEDLFTNSRTPITLDGTAVEYPFAVTTEAASTGNRFRIVFENSTLGIDNPKATGISILPNPITGDTFQVNFGTLGMGTYSYSICNTLGQEVEKGSINNVAQNSNSVVKFKNNTAAGMYIIKVTGTDNTVFSAKIIKK